MSNSTKIEQLMWQKCWYNFSFKSEVNERDFRQKEWAKWKTEIEKRWKTALKCELFILIKKNIIKHEFKIVKNV